MVAFFGRGEIEGRECGPEGQNGMGTSRKSGDWKNTEEKTSAKPHSQLRVKQETGQEATK